MKYLGFLLGLAILLSLNTFAHEQRTHQYVVREAWTMLQSQGFVCQPISTHLGYDQYSTNGDISNPWIVAGAYNGSSLFL